MQKTLENIVHAYLGESQARNRYTFYASIAKKEGYEQISEIFAITAQQEKEHASWLFKYIQELIKKSGEAMPEIKSQDVAVPTTLGTTIDNLKAAIAGENFEYTTMYPGFAEMADSEGLAEMAARMRSIAVAEKHHEERYKKILAKLEAGQIFKRDEPVEWTCRECGYVHTGANAPDKCPSCDHAQSFYQVKCEEF